MGYFEVTGEARKHESPTASELSRMMMAQKTRPLPSLDVTLWARVTEVAAEYCYKGEPLFIQGRLTLDAWDDKRTGQKRTKLKVVGEQIQLLGTGQQAASLPKPPRPSLRLNRDRNTILISMQRPRMTARSEFYVVIADVVIVHGMQIGRVVHKFLSTTGEEIFYV